MERTFAWLTAHRRLARDYERDPAAGARITTVSPGVISTAMGRQELAEPSGAFMRSMVENSGAARLGTSSDIAAAVATGKVALPEA